MNNEYIKKQIDEINKAIELKKIDIEQYHQWLSTKAIELDALENMKKGLEDELKAEK